MAQIIKSNIHIDLNPIPTQETTVSVQYSSYPLSYFGFNIPVALITVPLDKNDLAVKTKLVVAHFDTGASATCIDEELANELELMAIGMDVIQTANGAKDVKQYMVDVEFPNTMLKGYRLIVNSCNLPYMPNSSELNNSNFGLLLGRDIMANWNIVWNGPSSTVIISD